MDHVSSAPARSPRIDLTRPTDAMYWSRIFDLTLAELRDAVHHAGHEADAVQRYVREKRASGD